MPPIDPNEIIDCHMHVGLCGDTWPQYGRFSEWFQKQILFKIFLLYADIPEDQVTDTKLHDATVRLIDSAQVLDRVVCLALDPVYDQNGVRREDASNLWVANEYVLKLRSEVPDKVLFGASVHPYAPDFKQRVTECVNNGAVLLKWVPSSQQFSVGDAKVGQAMKFLATAKGGGPLPASASLRS